MRDKHILVAEDEEHTRLSLNLLLKRAGYEVSAVSDGGRALEFLEKDRSVDMLLTDVQMPEMDGLELLRNLRQNDIKLPVIVFTGYGEKEILVELLREGCQEYLDKPFRENDLLERIDKVFNLELAKQQQTPGKSDVKNRNIQDKPEKYKEDLEARKITDARLISDNFKAVLEAVSFGEGAGDFAALRDFPSGANIFVADVATNDFGGEHHTSMLNSFFEENCRMGQGGETLFRSLNSQLIKTGRKQHIVTGIHLMLDLNKMCGAAISAAHPYLFILKADTLALIRPFSSHSSSVLGLRENPFFELRSFSISPGDRLIIYTDGAPRSSRMNIQTGKREKLGDLGVRDILKKNTEQPLDIFLKRSLADIIAFSDGKYGDNTLFLGVEVPD